MPAPRIEESLGVPEGPARHTFLAAGDNTRNDLPQDKHRL